MAIDAKVSFLGSMERKLADKLTMADLTKCLEIMSDVLQDYDMRECSRWEESTKDDLLDSYVAALEIQSKSRKTIDRYARLIQRFTKDVNVPTRKINVYHIRNWLAEEKKRGLQDSSLEGTRQVLSAYFGWLFRESLIEKNPMINVGVIKVPKKKKLIYTEIEIEKLNRSCKTIRDKAIIHFLASTGCRVGEMIGLDRDSVNLKTLECIVRGKGNKERVVYLNSVTGMLIQEYLNSRTDDNPALFVGLRGERLMDNGVRVMLNTLAKRAGITTKVHPHKFRRTLASELSRHGMPIQEVASILGHEKIDTTMEYVVLNAEDVKSSYRRYA